MKNNTILPLFSLILLLLQSCANKKEEVIQNEPSVQLEKKDTAVTAKVTEKSVQYVINVEIIDSLQYRSLSLKNKGESKEVIKITNLKEAKKLLKGIVEFDGSDDSEENQAVKKINFRNGKKYEVPNEYDYSSFVAYYPEEDILLCEGGHATDVSFNLKNGEETELTGNPDLFIFSPNNTFRLNGSFDGQECNGYFIQKNSKGAFEKIINLETEFEKQTKFMLCNIRGGFWTDDHTLLLEKFDYGMKDFKYKFFKIEIREK